MHRQWIGLSIKTTKDYEYTTSDSQVITVCDAAVWLPTVRLRPTAESGSAIIQTLSTVLLLLLVMLVLLLLPYTPIWQTHKDEIPRFPWSLPTHTHSHIDTVEGKQLWYCNWLTSLSPSLFHSLSRSLFFSPLSLTHKNTHNCAETSVYKLIWCNGASKSSKHPNRL